MNSSDCHGAARRYLERGWAVIPIEPHGKRPTVAWQDFQSRLPTRTELESWFRPSHDANVGIVTGAISGFVVIDVDPRHDGDTSLAELENEHGPLPSTVEAATGGGGRHLYFLHPGGVIRNRVGIAPGIDLRGDGGCVVAPPSLHASGKRYLWLPEHDPDAIPLAPLPAWLLRLAQPAGSRAGHPLAHWRKLVREGVGEGERNSTIASLSGHLLWRDVDPRVALELLLAWNRLRCRPPLSDEEVAKIVDSISGLHARERAAGRVSEP